MTELEKKQSTPLEADLGGVDLNPTPMKNSNSAQHVISQFSGPIPPPVYLEHYDRLVPGTAKRFLEEPHIEAEHRRALEKQMVQEQIKLSKRGQLFSFFLATFSITGAFVAIYLGSDIAGLGALFLSLASLVGVFYYAQKKQ